MKDKILRWFGSGKVGASSKAMALAAVGIPNDGSHPHDPADFNRCLLLLDAVPEIRSRMDFVSDISETWAVLVSRWDEIETCFLDEAGLDWCKKKTAPRTYSLMKAVMRKGGEVRAQYRAKHYYQ